MRKDETTEAPAASPATEKGVVMAAPGSGSLRWICEDCQASHLAKGWRRADAGKESEWFGAALNVTKGMAERDQPRPEGFPPANAELLPRAETAS